MPGTHHLQAGIGDIRARTLAGHGVVIDDHIVAYTRKGTAAARPFTKPLKYPA